jgi:type IV secretory pathway TraG/TraD family ATPase VirD4
MNEIFVGRTVLGQNLAIPDDVRTGHVQVVGATGRGKTESVIVPWLLQDTIQEKTCVLIDGKGDREIVERIKVAQEEVDLDPSGLACLDLSDIEGSFATNPLLYGSPQQVVDRIFSSFTFENEYFKSVSQEAVLLVVRVLKAAGKAPSFSAIFEALQDDGKFSQVVAGLPLGEKEKVAKGVERLLLTTRRERMEKFSGLLSQLSPFAEGELSALVNATGEEENFFSLTEALLGRGKKTVVILLPQLLYQEMAASLGKILLQEVAWAVGTRESNGYRDFTSLYLDEFGSFVYPGFIGLLNKARSTRVAIHLSHQSLGDIRAVSPEFATALHTNTNVKCILGVNDPETSDFFAKHFGTRKAEKKTERAEAKGYFGDFDRTGHMSVRDVEEYKIDPNNLRNYSRGMGAISMIVNGQVIAEEIQFARAPF